MSTIAHDPDEIIAVVNEKDEVIGQVTRKEAHITGALHRETAAYLINSKQQVLLQQRSDNSLWDHSSLGHFSFSQDYVEGAVKEFEEELGIKLDKSDFKEIAKEKISVTSHQGKNNRFVKVFLIRKDIPLKDFKIGEGEVEAIQYFNHSELKTLLSDKEKTTKSTKYFLEKYVFKELQ